MTALPLEGTRDTLKKRVQRFVKNAGVTVEAYYSRWRGASCTGWQPVDVSNEAFKLGVNYMLYGLTH